MILWPSDPRYSTVGGRTTSNTIMPWMMFHQYRHSHRHLLSAISRQTTTLHLQPLSLHPMEHIINMDRVTITSSSYLTSDMDHTMKIDKAWSRKTQVCVCGTSLTRRLVGIEKEKAASITPCKTDLVYICRLDSRPHQGRIEITSIARDTWITWAMDEGQGCITSMDTCDFDGCNSSSYSRTHWRRSRMDVWSKGGILYHQLAIQ